MANLVKYRSSYLQCAGIRVSDRATRVEIPAIHLLIKLTRRFRIALPAMHELPTASVGLAVIFEDQFTTCGCPARSVFLQYPLSSRRSNSSTSIFYHPVQFRD